LQFAGVDKLVWPDCRGRPELLAMENICRKAGISSFLIKTFMGKEDYLLREIEKISIMLKFILNKLTGSKENSAMAVEKQYVEAKELLLSELNFDLEKFKTLSEFDSAEYISHFKGNNPANLELLAEIMFQTAAKHHKGDQTVYFEKALQIYEICNLTDNTYSIERENRISSLRDLL
jgi:hypothetical protein